MALSPARSEASRRWDWNDPRFRGVVFQCLAVLAVVLVGRYLIGNAIDNMTARRISSGFGYLGGEAGFEVGEHLIAFNATHTYVQAILVGVLNTLQVAIIGVVMATLLGTFVGLARLSPNWLARTLASTYVEVFRNTPVLLQLFFWYQLITEALPNPRQAIQLLLPGVFLSNRGLKFPIPQPDPLHVWMWLALAVGVVLTWLWTRSVRTHQAATGIRRPLLLPALGFILGLPILVWLIGGAPLVWDMPQLRGFNFTGGRDISPELTSLTVALTIYTASFIAEIVRAGILAVPHGQIEAARALGLGPNVVMRLVTLPQAMRVIIPPMTTQYMNLTKNSTLAIAVGYPELMQITNTIILQSGQALESLAILMAVFLSISIGISTFMNWYNKRVALKER